MDGCKSYDEVDFQVEKCKEPPSGNVKVTNMKNLRWVFTLEGLNTSTETEPIRVVWIIDGISFAARQVSYQFNRAGEQKVSVVMTNRCFMQTMKETTVKIN